MNSKKRKKEQVEHDIDSPKIRKFIKSLNGAERIYTYHTIDMAITLSRLVSKTSYKKPFTKEEFCKHFDIKPRQFKSFTSGDWMYDLMIRSKLEVALRILWERDMDEKGIR